MPTQRFDGVIGPTWRESTPWWPPDPIPPPGAPNVVVIVLDDVGFAQLGCYGSDIDTPNIDALAATGVRLSNFHTTALCSPTRACLLTGRNHHSNGMGRVADLAVGYPGYNGIIPRHNGFLPEILATAGYVPQAVGKWHLTPEDEIHMAAPRGSWPIGRGFQRWYGFHGGETHQFVPTLYQDNHMVAPPRSPEDGYHLTEDLADRAIRYLGELRSVDPEAPFLLYFATGACHSPHHAPAEYIERYRGHFDEGFDIWRERTFARQQAMGLLPATTELSPRPPWVPAWADMDPEDQKVSARFQECFAGFLTHADAQIGRVLGFLDDLGERDDTLVVLLSDNGASSEGGVNGSINDARVWNVAAASAQELRQRIDEIGTARTHNNYPWGWTMAGNTPFKRWKREVHEGGIADPCIVSWPARIEARGEIRTQFVHVIDVLPTVLELTAVEAPESIEGIEQNPIEGTSFAYLLKPGAHAEPGRHTTQYFEMMGSRAIVHDGWKAVTFKPMGPLYNDGIDPDLPFDEDRWELYHVAEDLSECHDLAEAEPEQLEAMKAKWWEEARKYQVLPLDNRALEAILYPRRPHADRNRYVYWARPSIVPESNALNVRNRPHRITAEVHIPEGGGEGVLLAMGTVLGGWSLQVHEGHLRYLANFLGRDLTVISSSMPVPAGDHVLGFRYETKGDFRGDGYVTIDGVDAGHGRIPHATLTRYTLCNNGVTCGWEQGPAIGSDYMAPFAFTGGLRNVVVEAEGDALRDVVAEFESIMSEQ